METLKVGTSYLMRHSRKGQAEVEVVKVHGAGTDDEWVDIKLLSRGLSSLSHNQPQVGNEMRVRRSFCEFVEKVF